MPPLPADSIHARACKLKCEKILTRPLVVLFEKALGIGKRGEARVEYRKVYFRIRSRYQFDSGWPAETDAAKFHEESRSLFQSAGWDLQKFGKNYGFKSKK